MKASEIKDIINIGESSTIEFKSSFNDEAIETLVAFANTKGGRVLIGIDKNGKLNPNVRLGKETLQNWANEIKQKTQPSIIPDIETIDYQNKTLVVISVSEFPVKPISFKSRYFKRVKNSNHVLSAIEIADLSLQSLQLSWDSYPAHGKALTDIDLGKVEKFIEKVNLAGRFSLEGNAVENLEKLRFVNKGTITNAAILLFGKGNIPYNIHLGRFKTESYIIDDKMYSGTLFAVVEDILKYIVSQIKVAFEITGKTTQRTEIFEYPLPALRELVLNAIIHRDYLSPIDIQIKIFDNKITFFNPGKLFGDLTVEHLKTNNYQAYSRNKLLSEAFYLTGDIEKYGSGFKRIANELTRYPTMKLVCSEIPNGFLAELSYEVQKTQTDQKTVEKSVEKTVENTVEKTVEKIVASIFEKPSISIAELQQKTGLSRRGVEWQLDSLKQKGILKRIGPDKGGRWEVTK